jgi:hypothetical protein
MSRQLAVFHSDSCPSYKIPVPSAQFFAKFGPDGGTEFFATVKLSIHVAAAISPVLLFIGKKLAAKKFRRDQLIHVSHIPQRQLPF